MNDRFRVVQAAWREAPQGPAHPGVVGRIVRTGNLEVHHLAMERGGSSEWEASPAETFVQVIEGKVRLEVLGNAIVLDPERYAVLPPNLPFALANAGRSAAAVLMIRC